VSAGEDERTCLFPFDDIKVATKRLSGGKIPLSKVPVAKGEFVALVVFFTVLLKGMKIDYRGQVVRLVRNLEELSASILEIGSDSLSFEGIDKAGSNSL
jgi:hypothetical protein